MEVAQVPNSSTRTGGREKDQLHMKKKTLRSMLEQCQIALESISNNAEDKRVKVDVADDDEELSPSTDSETNQLCDALKSTFESPKFMEKLGNIHSSFPQNISAEEGSSWDLVSEKDLWEGVTIDGGNETDQESYVVVRQDDVVEGIACFMAAYLLSLEQTKDLTPNQLQEALSKTFSLKKKKGKLQKAWAGSKVIYNVASWGATAIGIYQNPALIGAASLAFWNSCHVISKLL